MHPIVVEIRIGSSGAGAVFALEISKQTCELGNFLQGCGQFGIGGGESIRECAAGCGERCHRGAITVSGCGQVGDFVNSVL